MPYILENLIASYFLVSFLTYYVMPDYGDKIYESLEKILQVLFTIMTTTVFSYPEPVKLVDSNDNSINDSSVVVKVEVKFEDKYKEEYAKLLLKQEPIVYTEDELRKLDTLVKKYKVDYYDNLTKEIDTVKQTINDLESELVELNIDGNVEKSFENHLQNIMETYSEERFFEFAKNYEENKKGVDVNLTQTKEHLSELLEEQAIPVENIDWLTGAKTQILVDRQKSLKNCYIFEKTPLGNVAMCYDYDKNSFDYYSDNTLPYRFLEPVGRKYVLTFKCKDIFVNMDEELKAAEVRADEKKKEDEEKARKEKEEKTTKKRSVFAKLKEYNAPSNSKNAAVGSKNNNMKMPSNIQANFKELNAEPEKLLLKENSNHYRCQGRFSNMKILQQVSRKVVDKKYAMTFADFKKQQQKQ
jgi:hypothetical protein